MADPILEDAAKRYNVPLGVLEGIAAAEGQSWDLVHPGGEVGRFGLHPIHEAEIKQLYGLTMEQLRWRPDIQVEYWVPRIAEVWNSAIAQGKSTEQAAWDVVNKVQAPQAQYREREVSSILQHLGQGGEITMAGQISPTEMPGYTPLSASTQTSTTNEEALKWAEEQWEIQTNWYLGMDEKLDRAAAEKMILGDAGVFSKDEWIEKKAQERGYTPEWQSALQFPMSDYETQTLAIQQEQADLNNLIAEQDYLIRTKQITFEQAATNIANRISATATGASLAQTAEDIRTSQMKRRMPAPNVPGGYQPIDPAQFTKYGMTAPQPVPVQPAIFEDPWAEMERGRQAVGPTDVPPAEFGPSPFAGGSSIIEAYNAVTGGGAPTPGAQGMGPTPDILTPGMQPPAAPQRLRAVSAREALPQVPQHPGLGAPSAPMEGQVWLNPISGQELIWRGGQWVPTMSMGQPPTMTPGGMRDLFEEGR